jgi:hypothetical protein
MIDKIRPTQVHMIFIQFLYTEKPPEGRKEGQRYLNNRGAKHNSGEVILSGDVEPIREAA